MISDKTKLYRNIVCVITFIVFTCISLYMLLNCIHVIRDIDDAELSKTILSYILLIKFETAEIIASILDNCDSQAFLSGALPFSLFYSFIASIFGVSYLSLKLSAFIFALGTFIIWLHIIKKFFPTKTLIIFCFFYLMPPLYMQKWYFTFWASHPESIFFSSLILLLYIKNSRPVLIALTSGFSCYLSLFTLPMVFAIILDIYFNRKKYSSKYIIQFLLAFFIGISPWFLFQYYNQAELINNQSKINYLIPNFKYMWDKLIVCIFYAPRFGPVFTIFSEKISFLLRMINQIFFLFCLISTPLIIKYFSHADNKKVKQTQIIKMLFIYTISYFIAISLSSHRGNVINIATTDIRYFVPLFVIYFALSAINISILIEKKKSILFIIIPILTIYTAINIYDYINFINLGERNAWKKYHAVNYYRNKINAVTIEQADDINTAIKTIKDKPFFAGFSSVFFKYPSRYLTLPDYTEFTKSDAETITDINNKTKEIKDPVKQKNYLIGIGYALVIKYKWQKEQYLEIIKKIHKEYMSYINTGVSMALKDKHLYK